MKTETKFATVQFKGTGNMWPLYTKTDLAKRWNVSLARLNNWEKRHDDFPPRVEGVIAGDLTVYGNVDVQQYERARGGSGSVATHNAAAGNR